MRIHSGLCDGQVLQRLRNRATVTVLGAVASAGPVTASIRVPRGFLPGWRARRVGRAARGSFRARLVGLPTGGPYRVELAVGSERVTVADVFVGDVWILAGQSNMEGYGVLASAPKPHALVRARSMDGRWRLARDPLHVLEESSDPVHNPGRITAAAAKRSRRARVRGAGVGIPFAAALVERTGAPQGLICAAHGGTTMAEWDPALRGRGGESLYGSLLASWRATGQPVAGVLWYQGESDTSEAQVTAYTAAMRRFVAALRRDLGQPRLPFLLVQLGRHVATGSGEHPCGDPRWWNALQEHQRRLPELIPCCGVVAAADLSLDDGVHISTEGFARLGPRLARLAAHLVHGDRREPPPPALLSVRRVERDAPGAPPCRYEVRFANVVGGLRSGSEPRGFTLVDAQGRPLNTITRVRLRGDTVVLDSEALQEDAIPRIQYGHGLDPALSITDARDLPLPVFGARPIENPLAITPFATAWRISAIQPGEDIAHLPVPEPRAYGPLRAYTDPYAFVNVHAEWHGHEGHAAFFGELQAPEAMTLDLRVGYDGPIRIWLGERQVLCDLDGINPAIPDARRLRVRVPRGSSRVVVLMALNHGQAYGFFLRASRPGGRVADIQAGRVPLPTFSAG